MQSTILGQIPAWPIPAFPLSRSLVTKSALRNHATISLLDDYQNNYPLRGDIGDRPPMNGWIFDVVRQSEL